MRTRRIPLRLAFREEDGFWNAYLTSTITMRDAMLIGSIVIGPAKGNPEIKASFMAVMQQVYADLIEDVTGKPPVSWETVDLSDHL